MFTGDKYVLKCWIYWRISWLITVMDEEAGGYKYTGNRKDVLTRQWGADKTTLPQGWLE